MPAITKQEAERYGIPRSSIQTIQIPLSFSLKKARVWLKEHGYLYRNYRTTLNYRRFIQNNDIIDAEYRSKVLPNGVIIVWQFY